MNRRGSRVSLVCPALQVKRMGNLISTDYIPIIGPLVTTYQSLSPEMQQLFDSAPLGTDPATWPIESNGVHPSPETFQQTCDLLQMPPEIFKLIGETLLRRRPPKNELPDDIFNFLSTCKSMHRLLSPLISWKDPLQIWESVRERYYHYDPVEFLPKEKNKGVFRYRDDSPSYSIYLMRNGAFSMTMYYVDPDKHSQCEERVVHGSWTIYPDRYCVTCPKS